MNRYNNRKVRSARVQDVSLLERLFFNVYGLIYAIRKVLIKRFILTFSVLHGNPFEQESKKLKTGKTVEKIVNLVSNDASEYVNGKGF